MGVGADVDGAVAGVVCGSIGIWLAGENVGQGEGGGFGGGQRGDGNWILGAGLSELWYFPVDSAVDNPAGFERGGVGGGVGVDFGGCSDIATTARDAEIGVWGVCRNNSKEA